jgi:hypothetical protein
MTIEIERVVKKGKRYRYERLQSRRFIPLALLNVVVGIWCALAFPGAWKLLTVLSVSAVIICVVRFVKDNKVTMPDWARRFEDLE